LVIGNWLIGWLVGWRRTTIGLAIGLGKKMPTEVGTWQLGYELDQSSLSHVLLVMSNHL
jgi:hypothetical protein